MSQPQGLGISASLPTEYPQTTTPSSGYDYTPDGGHYATGLMPSMSLSTPPTKRMKRTSSHTYSNDTPVDIFPHREGVQRIKHQRQVSRSSPLSHPRPRAPGRGRRDPQVEEEDAFVEDLRQRNFAWKIVREMFRQRFNKDASEARLQMRLLRRRKKHLTRWDDSDVSMCLKAHPSWEAHSLNCSDSWHSEC